MLLANTAALTFACKSDLQEVSLVNQLRIALVLTEFSIALGEMGLLIE